MGTVSCVSAIIFKQAVKKGYVDHERRPYTSVRRMVNDASIGRLALLAIPYIGPLTYFVYLVAQECLFKPVKRDVTHNLWRDGLSKKEELFKNYINSKSNTPERLHRKLKLICGFLHGAFPSGLQNGYPIPEETLARLDKSFEDDEVVAILEDLQGTYENLINTIEENFNSMTGLDIVKFSEKIVVMRSFKFTEMKNYELAVSMRHNIITLG